MSARPAAAPFDTLRASSASDVWAVLEDALIPKRDGTRHHRACLNRTMNASPTPCSDRCVTANRLLRTRPEQQGSLWEEVAG